MRISSILMALRLPCVSCLTLPTTVQDESLLQ